MITEPNKARSITIKQERFSQEYVATGNASEAYRRAYDTNGKRNNVEGEAKKLRRHPLIARRIAELEHEVAVHAGLTPAKIAAFLLADRELARNSGQIAAAIAADTRLGEMIGVLGTRRHVVEDRVQHEHIVANLAAMDDDALRALVELGQRVKSGEGVPALPEGISGPES